MGLSKEQIARYSRQLILPEVGPSGQERLLGASALIVGAGGLGSVAALYLAAAGVGTIGIVDRESVELSNLHRQILHATRDVGRPKTTSAQIRLSSLNSEIRVKALQVSLGPQNVADLLAPYDVILDGSDNFPTRYLVNDACVLANKILVHAGVVRFEGQLLTIIPRQSACFRCVFPEPPLPGAIPACQAAGVLGSCAGVIGSLMAHEALKVLLGIGEPLGNRLLVFDGKTSRFREVLVRRDLGCGVCGQIPTIHDLIRSADPCSGLLPSDSVAPGTEVVFTDVTNAPSTSHYG